MESFEGNENEKKKERKETTLRKTERVRKGEKLREEKEECVCVRKRLRAEKMT